MHTITYLTYAQACSLGNDYAWSLWGQVLYRVTLWDLIPDRESYRVAVCSCREWAEGSHFGPTLTRAAAEHLRTAGAVSVA